MNTAISLIPLAVFLSLYPALVKLAAWLYKRTRLAWRHALVFGLFTIALGAVVKLIQPAQQPTLALLISLAAIALQLAFGGWYFGARAFSREGAALGRRRGALLTLSVYGLVLMLGVLLGIGIPALQRLLAR